MNLTCSLSDVSAVADALIQKIGNHHIIAFHGNLGAGKTTLIKALCEKLGVTDEVSSPTFTIINEYHSKTGSVIYHFDCYRLKDPSEAYDIGIEEYFHSGHLCLVEWPENLGTLMPADTLHLAITAPSADTRTYVLE